MLAFTKTEVSKPQLIEQPGRKSWIEQPTAHPPRPVNPTREEWNAAYAYAYAAAAAAAYAIQMAAIRQAGKLIELIEAC